MRTNTIVAMAALLACAAETASAAPDAPDALGSCDADNCLPATRTPRRPGSATAHPCARISASWAEQKKKKTTTGHPTVAAALAHECLKTVPLGRDEAIQLIDAIEPYLEWQSDAAYKKDPPKDYFYPGFDIFGNLAKVKSNLQSGKYAGEYDFQTDLYKEVWAPAHDGHFVVYLDLLSRAFSWTRQPLPIVSISEDGTSLPVIKLQEHVVANPKTAQAITRINGIDAAKYVEGIANSASFLQDADASYNSMFWSKSTAANNERGNFVAGGRSSVFYHGPTTSLTFANGTTVELENLAEVVGNMTDVVDGPTMYKKFCSPVPMNATTAAVPNPAAANSSLIGYPKPVIATQDGTITGYYLSGEGLNHVAVIALTSFAPKSFAEFQAVTSDFLREASAAGKKKLVIDFQNNPGGYILLGYDFFRQLFPKTVQDGNSRWKQSKSFASLARVVSDAVKNVNPATETDHDLLQAYMSVGNYRYDLNLTDENFATFADKFAPRVYKNTEYTALMRWNVSDPLTTINKTFGIGIHISGYGPRTNLDQCFKPEDIIMLLDGACSSTCAMTSEFLRLLGGVKSVSMGGRPKKGPIQAVGGVKGAQVWGFRDVYMYHRDVGTWTNDTKIKAEFARYTTLPMERSVASVVNVRDLILRDNVNDGVPAQFVYEAADCRLYWTAPMISDVTEVWKAAANSAFNGAKCAAGGIAGSKPGRRSAAAAPIHNRRLPVRLSELVDKKPIHHDEQWKARHLQMAVN
ncbi:hypothetical protein C2857_002008 [Epichloe festucae Fl1]|uniref:CPAF-like PDZ domain-containing protein n=1 Tax=Epichloe festucae (strain Fl1) TaxID=877507 RepID=A0A7S9KUS8_EPIFF|nr:hypothetical protein C2857_002008 [Epichloe festucae Fl1]